MKYNLLILMLCFVTFIFACSDNSENTNPNVINENTTISKSVNDETTTQLVAPNVEQRDFDGKEFVVFARLVDSGYADWTATDITVDEQIGDPINDAVYIRNATLEDRYNFKLRVVPSGTQDSYNVVTKSLLAADDNYDVIAIKGADSVKLGVEGFSIDLNTLDYIDLDREYWSHNIHDVLTINDKLYQAVGDISIIDNYGIRCLYFNKDILNDLGLDDPYVLVKDGKWTIDKMFEIGAKAVSDLNGDGVMGIEDRYGMMAQKPLGSILSIGGGVKVIGKDTNGIPAITIDNERSVNVIDLVRKYVNNKDEVYLSDDWQDMLIRFNDGLTLFYAEVLLHIETMRGYEMSIGILPAPKFDEVQDKYWQFLDGYCCNFYSVPVTNTTSDDAAFFLEVMSAESMNTLTPTFYDICLNGKYLRDEESSEMLDIILNSYVVEFSEVFGLSIYWGLNDVINKDTEVTSFFASIRDKSQTELNIIVDKFS